MQPGQDQPADAVGQCFSVILRLYANKVQQARGKTRIQAKTGEANYNIWEVGHHKIIVSSPADEVPLQVR